MVSLLGAHLCRQENRRLEDDLRVQSRCTSSVTEELHSSTKLVTELQRCGKQRDDGRGICNGLRGSLGVGPALAESAQSHKSAEWADISVQ